MFKKKRLKLAQLTLSGILGITFGEIFVIKKQEKRQNCVNFNYMIDIKKQI